MKGDLLVSEDFGTLGEFTVKPMGAQYMSFTFDGEHNLCEGVYNCDDTFYCVVNCSFTSVEY